MFHRVLVFLQFFTAATLVLTTTGVTESMPAIALILIGAGLGVWAWLSFGLTKITVSPALRSDASLVTKGPYRIIRHPMYTAVVVFCLGFLVASFSVWKLLVWLTLVAVVAQKSRIEEALLRERFPEYEQYAKRTGRFLPHW
ncbi:MAG: methyltransferase family protein [Rhodopirellula sp. JB053]